VIPFRVQFRPGIPLYEQVTYAATKAMLTGRMRPGDPFPSVRVLSKELKINPNTAHKVVSNLIATGLLESRPGIGTVVAALPASNAMQRTELLGDQIEQIVVEAQRLGITLDDVQHSISQHWKKFGGYWDQRGGRGGR
jgi:GntR family transcriptional regulator